MPLASIDSSYHIIKLLLIFGFLILSIIDSVLVVIASKRGVEESISGFPGWLKLHYKYGIWKVNSIKIVISIVIPYPELALSPRLGILFFYLLHVIIFSYRLLLNLLNRKDK